MTFFLFSSSIDRQFEDWSTFDGFFATCSVVQGDLHVDGVVVDVEAEFGDGGDGDDKGSRPPPKRMISEKFRGGGGVIFNPKIYIADFCHFIDDTSVMNFGKNLQYDFPKMRGGVKCRLVLFQKFIRFGGAGLP